MASIKLIERPDGTRKFEIRVSRGRGKTQVKTSFNWPETWSKKTAEREALKYAIEFERQVKNGEYKTRSERKQEEQKQKEEDAKLKTVEQYSEQVFMMARPFSENTRSSYSTNLNKHVYPVIGDTRLIDVTPAMLTKLLIEFQNSGAKHSSVIKLYNILNGVFGMAFMDDSIPINPMAKVKRPSQSKEELVDDHAKAYTVDEMRYIINCIHQAPLKWQTFMWLLIDTGCRRGEACGLQWSDVDFDKHIITFRRNLQYTSSKGVYETTPKNAKVKRVDIGDDVLTLLQELRAEQASTCISKYVFSQDACPDPIHPQSPDRYFKRFGARYDIEDFHPHKLRHTYASIALTHGADVVSVSERLGHSDTAVTLRMYAHANEESIRQAGNIYRMALGN